MSGELPVLGTATDQGMNFAVPALEVAFQATAFRCQFFHTRLTLGAGGRERLGHRVGSLPIQRICPTTNCSISPAGMDFEGTYASRVLPREQQV